MDNATSIHAQAPVAHRTGKVYLVGAGPGDPGLLTLRGKELLQRAEVVVYDYLANPRLLRYVPEKATLIYAGKKGGGLHAYTQEGINKLLVEHAKAGKMVVRLKGGDPFIFGRGGEEMEELAAEGVSFEVVPGVTSASAAATYTGIPITHREYTASVAFITGHENPGKKFSAINWDKLATGAGTLVIYMGIKNLPEITQKLMAAGRAPETPVAVVRWASTPRQESLIGTLGTISDLVQEAGIKPPALVVVGEVVQLRHRINWFERRPLFGRRIVVTRTRVQASELVNQLEEMGADCFECPTIDIREMDDYSVLDQALQRLTEYDWLLFTSPNAVNYFFRRLQGTGKDSRALAGARIAAVGTATAGELERYGISADLLPEQFTGEGLADALLAQGDVAGRHFLLPQAQAASKVLPKKLTAAGAQLTIAPVYRNVPAVSSGNELREALSAGAIDALTFTSSSTVRNCFALLGCKDASSLQQLLGKTRIAAIGPVTAATLQEYGIETHIQPQQYTIADLVEAIVSYYGHDNPLPKVPSL